MNHNNIDELGVSKKSMRHYKEIMLSHHKVIIVEDTKGELTVNIIPIRR